MGPAPQRFVVSEGQLQTIASAAVGAIVRLGLGALCLGYSSRLERRDSSKGPRYTVLSDLPGGLQFVESSTVARYPRPADTLVLYDVQDCPQCRKVREALSILDLDVLFKPCPRTQPGAEGIGFRAELEGLQGSNVNVPFLRDPNSGLDASGGDAIVAYLFRNYGNNRVPFLLQPGLLGNVTAALAMKFRGTRGGVAVSTPSKSPRGEMLPLELWAYEASPFCVVVREALSAAGLPHLQRTVARGSPNRQVLFERRGHFQAPYLEDPNTGVAMFESAAIIEYIHQNYGSA